MTEPKLKPCPFCGREPVYVVNDWKPFTTQEAIDRWNKRVPQTWTSKAFERIGGDANKVDRFNAVDFIKVMEMVKKPHTNEEWLRSATFEEMAGAIYEWHTKGYARGKNGLPLNPITEVVEWLKQPKE